MACGVMKPPLTNPEVAGSRLPMPSRARSAWRAATSTRRISLWSARTAAASGLSAISGADRCSALPPSFCANWRARAALSISWVAKGMLPDGLGDVDAGAEAGADGVDDFVGGAAQADGHGHAVGEHGFEVAGCELRHLAEGRQLILERRLQHQGFAEAEGLHQRLFQVGDPLDRPVDGDFDDLFFFGLLEEAVDLDPRQPEPLGDGGLGELLLVVHGGDLGQLGVQVCGKHGGWDGVGLG